MTRMNRRDFSGVALLAATSSAAASLAEAADQNAIVVDPVPLFDISPLLYMQFMEPLGITDGSVEAAWNYETDDWRKDFVEVVKDLAPDTLRFGGLFSRYYRWREGVGPVSQRPMMRNYVWGGRETNRVGTHEFVDFCRRAGAAPLICVNFLSDGEKRYAATKEGNRTADASEAADWVSYANDPGHAERKRNGAAAPFDIKLWQLGNETSYGNVTFGKDESIRHTIEFAKAMKARDRSIRLIGWGDRGHGEGLWAKDLVERAGEYLDFVAIHMMGQSPKRKDTVLKGIDYEKAPEQAWQELIELADNVERRVTEIEGEAGKHGIAITEGHLSLAPHNTNPILCEWLSSVYHARSLNIYQRHGARVKIATAADFEGNRWTNNAVMVPGTEPAYLLPVASIARLFKRHNGKQGISVKSAPAELDIAASSTGSRVFLHVVNMDYRRGVEAGFAIPGRQVMGGRVLAIAPENPREYVNVDRRDVFRPVETALTGGPEWKWRFPARSVSVVELECKAQ